MNILPQLRAKYETCTPIFDYELYALGFTDADIAETLAPNVLEELTGVAVIPCRIFYLVDYNAEFKLYFRLLPSSEKLIEKYFLGEHFEYGFYSGLTLQNLLGISTQVPAKTYLKSVRAQTPIAYGSFVIQPAPDYRPEDADYIQLAAYHVYRGLAEYDVHDRVKALEAKCTDLDKLHRYEAAAQGGA